MAEMSYSEHGPANPAVRQVGLPLSDMLTRFFPGVVGAQYVINAPWSFQAAWAVMRLWIRSDGALAGRLRALITPGTPAHP